MNGKTVSDVMTTNVKTIPAESTLREAAQVLYENNIGGAPVVSEDGKLVGVISESDLLNVARKRAALPHVAAFGLFIAPEESLRRIYEDGATLLAEEVMTRKVVSLSPETPVAEAGDTLVKQKINRAPVIVEGKVVGIVTRHDLLKGVFDLTE
jgi:CBS domain-containing protein